MMMIMVIIIIMVVICPEFLTHRWDVAVGNSVWAEIAQMSRKIKTYGNPCRKSRFWQNSLKITKKKKSSSSRRK